MKTGTMQTAWQGYRDAIYPQGVSPIQNREVHQAFFAGAMIAFTAMHEATAHPNEAEAGVYLDKLSKEVDEVCQHKVKCARDRN